MYSNNYLKSNLDLIKSLVILIHAEAVSVNLYLRKKYGAYYEYEEHDITTWKHYINLTGEFHHIDSLKYPNGLEFEFNNENLILTKSLLDNRPLIREELLKFDTLFKKIIKKYPEAETLIKGIILPVTMDTIIEAKDGTILNYNKKLIEKQESSLIYELQAFIYNFKDRWLVNEYVLVDNIAISNFIINLTSNLILKILNIRLSKAGTDEVHSYLMNEYFKSNLELYKNVKDLEPEIRLFIYKNLKYLIKHTGKEHTLKILIDNILTPSGINTKEIIKKQFISDYKDNKIINNKNNLYINSYGKIDYKENFISNNGVYEIELGEENLEDHIISRNTYFNTIDKSKLTNERSKLLLLDYINSTRINPANEAILVYEIWLYRVFNKDINTNFNFIDKNTNIEYLLDEKTALYIITKSLLKLINKDKLKIKNFIISSIPSENFSEENLVSNTEVTDKVRNYLDEHDFVYNDKDIFKNLIKLNNLFWTYINDDYNPALRSDGVLIYERLHKPVNVTLSNEELLIDDMFKDPLTYNSNYDYRLTITEIVKQFIGYDIDKKTTIDNFLNNFKHIIRKLTSYTTQIRTINNYSNLYLTSSFNGHIIGPNLCKVTETTFTCLEPLNYSLKMESHNINNNIRVLDRGIGKIDFVDQNPYRLNMNVLNTDIYEVPISSEIDFSHEESKNNNNNFVYNLPGNF